MQELGYRQRHRPEPAGLAFTRWMGLIFPTVERPFYGEMVYRLESYLAEAGYQYLPYIHHFEQEKRYLRCFFQIQVGFKITAPRAGEYSTPVSLGDRGPESGFYLNVRLIITGECLRRHGAPHRQWVR